MKRYLWLTFYFVWLVLLSYSFFYLSPSWKKILNSLNTVPQIQWLPDIDTGNISEVKDNKKEVVVNTWTNNLTGELTGVNSGIVSDNTIWNIEMKNNNNQIVTWTNLVNTWEEQKVEVIPDSIYVWLAEGSLVKTWVFDNVYSVLWLTGPIYQMDWKRVYLQKIKSVDYLTEKTNINQLIQKIWGNIKETNLFWDKQLFVNPDKYYWKIVIMLVEYNGSLYLVTLPYNDYKQYKNYIQDVLFVKN